MDKKMVPEVRFKGFTDDWEQLPLSKISNSFSYGLNVSSKKYDGKNKYIRITDIDDNSHKLVEKNLTSPNTNLEDISDYQLKENDLLFARTGASVGKSYLYDNADGKAFFAGFLIRMEINGEFDKNFVFQNTLTDKYQQFIKITSQRSGQPGINAKEYASFKIIIPKSFNEQRLIGKLYFHLDNLITLQQRQLDLYKKLKKGLLQKLFPKDGEKVPKVRFADFHDDWKQFKLKELGDIQTGNTPSTSDENNYSNNGMMWVTPTDIDSLLISNTSKKLSKLGQSKARIAKRGSVLVTCIASIGKNTLITEDASFNQQINSLTPSSKNNSYFLLTQSSQWSKKMKYIAASGTMQIVNKKDFSNIETYVPSLNEQNEMGLLFKKLDWIIILYQNKINKQKLLKKYLLQNLFI